MNTDDRDHENRPEDGNEAQIEALLASLELEKAPARLTRRLMRIPREEGGRKPSWAWWPAASRAPSWRLVPAFAAVPLLVLAVVLMQGPRHSSADVEKARQDLAVAFAYIDKAGLSTGNQIQAVIGGELRHSVKDTLSKHIPFTAQSLEEEST
jgi:hypothetical protein